MRGINRIVNTSFWDDNKVIDNFTPEDKYFMLYLLTNPHTTQLGIYEFPIAKASFELGYTKESIVGLLDRFETKHGIIKYSKDTKEVLIKNFLRHSIVKGGKPVEDCLKKEETKVKDKSLLVYLYKYLDNYTEELNATVIDYLNILKDKYKDNDIDNDNDNENERIVNESYHESSTNRKKTTNIDKFEKLLQEQPLDYQVITTNPLLYETIIKWLEYKDDKGKQHLVYADRSLKTLLDTFMEYGISNKSSELAKVVNQCIGANYQGITWDKLNQYNNNRNATNDRQSIYSQLMQSIKEQEVTNE